MIDAYGDGSLYQQAQILAQTGEPDRAMETLYQALKAGDSGLTYLYIDPMLSSLRERTDYKQLLAQLGFV